MPRSSISSSTGWVYLWSSSQLRLERGVRNTSGTAAPDSIAARIDAASVQVFSRTVTPVSRAFHSSTVARKASSTVGGPYTPKVRCAVGALELLLARLEGGGAGSEELVVQAAPASESPSTVATPHAVRRAR